MARVRYTELVFKKSLTLELLKPDLATEIYSNDAFFGEDIYDISDKSLIILSFVKGKKYDHQTP